MKKILINSIKLLDAETNNDLFSRTIGKHFIARGYGVAVYLLLVISMGMLGCTHSVQKIFRSCPNKYYSTTPNVSIEVHKTNAYTLQYPTQNDKKIRMRYLGCGGFYMADASNALLIDPYFSNKRLLAVSMLKMKTKPGNVKYGLEAIETDIREKVRGIFVTHSHFDHMLDVPYIYHHNTDTATTNIYTSLSGANIMANVVAAHVVNMEHNSVSNYLQNGKQYFLGTDSSILVTPIYAEHAPHYKNIRFYTGQSEKMSQYHCDTCKTRASQWKLGTTFAFLVDFLDKEKNIDFRIFIQSSAAQPKYGFITEELLNRHPVNLAILGAASFDYVWDYPEAIIDHLRPEKIIICHWEDFFKPYTREEKRTVRFTNLRKFIYRLNSIYPYTLNGVERFSMPDPKTDITIEY